MSDPPIGTVTFLYTDIEGSTKRWELHPQAMREAMQRHDAILRQAIEANGGHVFRTEGDAFRAAFSAAPQALQAALDAQLALFGESWNEEIAPIQVRIALHIGAVEIWDGDYVGPSLNRLARLVSAAHGGQTLLSHPVEQLVRDSLPPNVTLRDLGERRLKDLIRPERIYQVIVPELPSDFPPLNTLDNHPNNLPAQPTQFIGREKEVAAVKELIKRQDVHLLTLTGPGGTGKTRLALQAAADLTDEAELFKDGVFFVNLAPITNPDLVPYEVAQALDVRESGELSVVEMLKDHLRNRHTLLVLDNFEQVVRASPFVGDLLSVSTGLKVLVTSREVLRIYGERSFPVPPLSLPDAGRLPPLERLTQFEAVRLFVERAMAVKPDFEVTNENAPAVAAICYRLDGLPLAIELAAARIRLLPPQAILARLQDHAASRGEGRLRLLTGGARDLPARQQTLRNAIEWSYDLLEEGEKQLFRRLAIFRGGRTLEAIEAVCIAVGDLESDVLNGVDSLLTKSLLRQEEDAARGEPRFVMLETIHEYARERLEESVEAQEVGQRHASYFLDLVEESERGLQGHEQATWLRRLDAEYDNIRAALSWAATHQPEIGFRLAGSLSTFWEIRGYLSEGRRILSELLSLPEATAVTAERAKALNVAGNLADVAGDFAAAHLYYGESLASFRELGDKRMISRPLNGLGVVFWKEGDFAAARSHMEESLAIKRELADKPGTSVTLNNLGILTLELEDYAAARAYFEECLGIDRELKDDDAIATSLGNLGAVALDEGNYQEARALLLESVLLFQKVGDKLGIADGLEKLVGLAGQTGEFERAPTLGGAAEVLREEISAPLSPPEKARYERYLDPARSQLDPVTWEQYWADGRKLSTEQAIAFCVGE